LAALAASAASVDGVDDVDHVNHVGVGGVLPSFGFAASWNAGMGKAMVVRSSGGSGQGEGGGGGGGESKVTSSLKESTDATITIDMMDIVATEHTENTEHSMHGDSDSAAASSLAQLEAAVGEEGRTLGSAAGPATRRLLRVAAWLEGLEWQRLPVSASSDMAHTLRKTVSHTVLADGGVVVSCSANAGAAGAAGAVGPAGEGGEGGSKDNHLLLVPQGECAVNSLVASIEREGGLDDELAIDVAVVVRRGGEVEGGGEAGGEGEGGGAGAVGRSVPLRLTSGDTQMSVPLELGAVMATGVDLSWNPHSVPAGVTLSFHLVGHSHATVTGVPPAMATDLGMSDTVIIASRVAEKESFEQQALEERKKRSVSGGGGENKSGEVEEFSMVEQKLKRQLDASNVGWIADERRAFLEVSEGGRERERELS
jgi:hypothetical protein